MVKFNVYILPFFIAYDFSLQLLASYMLFALSKRVSIFLINQTLIMGILYVGNAVKISFFGSPITPADVFTLPSLLLILEGWKFLATAIPLVAVAILVIFNFSMRHWSAYLASLGTVLLTMTVVYQPTIILEPIDKYTFNAEWNQTINYMLHGATLYSLQETARFFALADTPPSIDTAQAAANRLLSGAIEPIANDKPFTPRNIHIILLESFWDANTLKNAGYNQDPLSPEFRNLWESTGYSHALTSVFGGYTANSEFEMLCGFPVTDDKVKFVRQLVNEAPCLPYILANKGYKTVASHPNVPKFWNRVHAYHNVGFQTYWAKDDFVLDDMNRNMLADSSLYGQVLEKLSDTLDKKQPILDYIVTYFGHEDYPLNASRPNKITSTSKVEEVTSYANTIYYKSRELITFIEQLRKRDPDSIIVMFGDHLPFLGGNFAGYVESSVLTSNSGNFSADMFKIYVSTPLVIIDGQKGALSVGYLPLYQVPKLLLKLLNYNESSIMDYTMPLSDKRIRPLPSLHFILSKEGDIELCKEPPFSKSCQVSSRWLQDVLVVSNDLFIGQQFTRPKHPVSEPVHLAK
ncbi:MAG: hypothetical protein RIQ94_2877, partial [Pseudomonadota bacterium]|jgi:phosphoglycerol transferase MdoB-like AlkP superfamily enzyme